MKWEGRDGACRTRRCHKAQSPVAEGLSRSHYDTVREMTVQARRARETPDEVMDAR